MSDQPDRSLENSQPDLSKVEDAVKGFGAKKVNEEAEEKKKTAAAKKNRQTGAKKARAKRVQKKARKIAKNEKASSEAQKSAKVRLSADEKQNLVAEKQREFFSLEEENNQGSRSVHTFDSKKEELELAGHFHIGRTWASFSSKGDLLIGPADRIEDAIQLPEKAWEVPVFDDGTGIRAAPVPPPVELYGEFFPGLDDSYF